MNHPHEQFISRVSAADAAVAAREAGLVEAQVVAGLIIDAAIDEFATRDELLSALLAAGVTPERARKYASAMRAAPAVREKIEQRDQLTLPGVPEPTAPAPALTLLEKAADLPAAIAGIPIAQVLSLLSTIEAVGREQAAQNREAATFLRGILLRAVAGQTDFPDLFRERLRLIQSQYCAPALVA